MNREAAQVVTLLVRHDGDGPAAASAAAPRAAFRNARRRHGHVCSPRGSPHRPLGSAHRGDAAVRRLRRVGDDLGGSGVDGDEPDLPLPDAVLPVAVGLPGLLREAVVEVVGDVRTWKLK